MAEVGDRMNLQLVQPIERFIGEVPVIVAGTAAEVVVLRAVPDEVDAGFLHQIKITLPMIVVFR